MKNGNRKAGEKEETVNENQREMEYIELPTKKQVFKVKRGDQMMDADSCPSVGRHQLSESRDRRQQAT